MGLAWLGAGTLVAATAVTWYLLVRHGAHDRTPGWCPPGRTIVMADANGGPAHLALMNADGTDRRALSSGQFDESAPACTRDGSRIAFDTNRDGNFEIYTMNVDGSNQHRVTSDEAADLAPTWSPDGTQIAFMSDRAARGVFDLYLMAADGQQVRRLTTSSASMPQFSPDGRALAFESRQDAFVLDIGSLTIHRVGRTPGIRRHPTWSPDGTRLAFAGEQNGKAELMASTIDGQSEQLLASLSNASVADPQWSPDGRNVAFVAIDKPLGDETSPTVRRAEGAIFTIELASGRVTRVSP